MSWNQFSETKLVEIEQKILSVLKSAYNTYFVKIQYLKENNTKIWTISLNADSKNTPLVLLHGFAAGIGFWVRNLDDLSKKRPVHALDLLGFGRSSRPEFSSDSLEAEQQMVQSIEAWREQMKLDKMILLGHSMGAYLATSYSISYPEHVQHLILADPWGFGDRSEAPPKQLPMWIKVIGFILYPFTNLNPLATVRALGPWGPWLIQKLRGDIIHKFDDVLEDTTIIPNYIYQCNAQKPTGEQAFHGMIQGFGWAKNPMIRRVSNLDDKIPITMMYGSNTWIDKLGDKVKELKPNSYVDVQIIQDSGHHVYADQPDQFNEMVQNVCEGCDKNIFRKNIDPNCDNNERSVKEVENIEETKTDFEIINN